MGYWGTGIFEGDPPLDLVGDIERWLERRIASVSHADGYKRHLVAPLAFVLADFRSHYGYRAGVLKDVVARLRAFRPEDWSEERVARIQRLTQWIESWFALDGSGYRDPKDCRPARIAGRPLYHLTLAERVPQIQAEGLKPSEPAAGWWGNLEGVYASESLACCLRWRHHVTSHDPLRPLALARFTVTGGDRVFEDGRVDFRGDYVVCNRVAPERLTILD